MIVSYERYDAVQRTVRDPWFNVHWLPYSNIISFEVVSEGQDYVKTYEYICQEQKSLDIFGLINFFVHPQEAQSMINSIFQRACSPTKVPAKVLLYWNIWVQPITL